MDDNSAQVTVGDAGELGVAKGIVVGMLDQSRVGDTGEEPLGGRWRVGRCVVGLQRCVQVLFFFRYERIVLC